MASSNLDARKNPDYLKLKKKSASKNNNCCYKHIKHFDLAILGGGGVSAPFPLNPSMKPSSADCGSSEGSSPGR